jgi:hypothetical protein
MQQLPAVWHKPRGGEAFRCFAGCPEEQVDNVGDVPAMHKCQAGGCSVGDAVCRSW